MAGSRQFGVRIVGIALLAAAVLSCTSDGADGVTQPTEQRWGSVTVVYQPQVPCQSAGSPYSSRCARLSGVYVGINNQTEFPMVPQPDGSFVAAGVNAPSSHFSGRVFVRIADPWVCPPVPVCLVYTGAGVSVNGVRLDGGDESTSFLFYPPDTVTR